MESVVNKDPVYLFSTENMPRAPYLDTGVFQWFGTDLEKNYRENSHPFFGTNDISYNLNSRGYRCPEFSQRDRTSNTVNIVSIGCSITFGMGLPEDKTYPAVLAQLLQDYLNIPVTNWNLGLGGASADSICRNLISAILVLKPDILLLTFPPTMGRREYINENGRFFYFQPRKLTNQLLASVTNPELAAIYKANSKLLSSYNNAINMFKNYCVCESLCESADLMWLFCSSKLSLLDDMRHLIREEKILDFGIYPLADRYRENPEIGLARDMSHPGIQPNRELAIAFFDRLRQLYAPRLERLKQKIIG